MHLRILLIVLTFLFTIPVHSAGVHADNEEMDRAYLIDSDEEQTDRVTGNNSIPHHRHPRINPINPNLVAYEYEGNIRFVNKALSTFPDFPLYEIECERATQRQDGAPRAQRTVFDAADIGVIEEENPDFNCAYLDWRPVLDSSGNYWFSYTSSVNHTLNIGYINPELNCTQIDERTGQQITSGCEHKVVMRSQQRNIMRPKWSPDGQYLIFNDGDGLYRSNVLFDQIRKKNFSDFSVELLTRHAYYPDWSPNGRYIVYEYDPPPVTETTSEGIELRSELVNLYLLDLYSGGSESNYSSVRIDDLLILPNSEERVKPRWSQSGNYLSYLIPSVFEDRWDLKVVRIIYDDERDEILNLESISGRQSRAFVTDIFRGSELRNGFPITFLTAGDRSEEVLLFIERDQENQNPIQMVRVSRETVQQAIRRNFTKIGESRLNDNLDAVHDGHTTHLTFTSQEGASLRLQKAYLNLEFGEIPQRLVPVAEQYNLPRDLSPNSATLLSAVIPGGGQIYKGETGKGLLHLGAFAAATTGLVLFVNRNNDLNRDFNKKNSKLSSLIAASMTSGDVLETFQKRQKLYGELGELSNDISLTNTLIIASGVVMAGVYLYSIYDSRRGFPIIRGRDGSISRLTVQPKVNPGNYFRPASAGVQLNLTIN